MPVYAGLENWLRRNGFDRETQELADAGEVDHGAMDVKATVEEHVLERAEVKRERIGSTSQSQSPALATTSSTPFSLEPSPPRPPSPDDRLAPHWPDSKPAAATATDSSAIPPKFRPLVDYLQQKQAEGSPRVLLSRVALDLSKQDVKPSFSEHWKAALKLGIVKRAGPAQDWIELVVRFTCPSICRCKAVLTHDTRRRRFRRSFRLLPLPPTCQPAPNYGPSTRSRNRRRRKCRRKYPLSASDLTHCLSSSPPTTGCGSRARRSRTDSRIQASTSTLRTGGN